MELNQAYENLLSRRSCRAYLPDVLKIEEMKRLVQAGQYAPSAMGRQSTAFLAVSDPLLRNTLSRLNADVMRAMNPAFDADPFYGAPCVIAVFAKSGPNAVKDGAAAMENILLAASALNLGSCWINRAKEVFSMPEGKAIQLRNDIPEDYEGIGFVIAGYPKESSTAAAKERTSIVRFA